MLKHPANSLRPSDISTFALSPAVPNPKLMLITHQIHEIRSLRMHRIVAERFRQEPAEVIRLTLKKLERWHQQGVECEDFEVWRNLLAGPSQEIVDALTASSEEAIRLRQSSPFAGLIPDEDRRRILALTE